MSSENDPIDPTNGENNDSNIVCFVCCSVVKSEDKLCKTNQLISKNLNVIFLLKKLLQVPDAFLISYLKKHGDPVDWMFNLCESCVKWTTKALEIHHQIIKCQKELASVQMLIIEKIRSSTVKNTSNPLPINCTTWETSREFIYNHDYKFNIISPFVDGDKHAENIVERINGNLPPSSSSSSTNEQLICENNPSSPEIKNEINLDDDSDSDEDELYQDDDSSESEQSDKSEQQPSSRSKKYSRKTVKGEAPERKFRDWSKYEMIDGKMKCAFCDKVFRRREGIRTHEDEFHSSNPGQFICEICGKAWNAKVRLRVHKRDVHKLRPDGSIITEEAQTDNQDGSKGESVGRSKRRRKRKESDKGFVKFIRDWSKYEQIDGKIKCGFCEKVFSRKKAVRVHENEFHRGKPGQFVCDICGSSWNTNARLRQHKRDVHSLRPDGSSIKKVLVYTCHVCGKGFPTPSKLKRHLRSHNLKM